MVDTTSQPARRSEPPPPMRGKVSQLPDTQTILGWVYVGRLCIVAAMFGLVNWPSRANPGSLGASLFLLLAASLLTAVSYWHSHRRGRLGEAFVYAQVFLDALVVSGMVYQTGGPQSLFAPLYILVICAAALLLPFPGGIFTGLLASVLYVGSAAWASPDALDIGVFFQVVLFAVVAFVTAYLGDRLRQAGAALGEVETELRLLRLDTGEILDTITSGVLTVDGGGRLAYLNPAAAEILSLPAAQWAGKPVIETLDRIAPGLGTVISRSAEAGTAVRRFETEPAGEDSFVLGVSTTLMERPGGERPPVTAIFQDITERKRFEALRRRAERLEAVAELSASLAHEIKNPLASIRSAVEQITSREIDAEDEALLKALVLRESDRLSRLLSEFIDFARVRVTTLLPLDLPGLVRHAADVVRAHPDCQACAVEVGLEVSPEAVWIRGQEDVLHRAVFNLLLNAVQWAGTRGKVVVTLDEVRSDLLTPALGELSLARLTVSDSGPGVPEEITEHIFNPFFTRRPGGSGLGLALVQRAVEAHGGAVFVDNAPAQSGLGAMFTLYLPTLHSEPTAVVPALDTQESSSQ